MEEVIKEDDYELTDTMVRIRPDYRNDTKHGQYQFVVGYTGFGAKECVHLTFEQIKERLTESHGPGKLEDDGEWLTFTFDERQYTDAEKRALQRDQFEAEQEAYLDDPMRDW